MGLHRVLGGAPASHAEGEAAGHAGVWIYHRAGCPFCVTLTLTLNRRAAQAHWVDIWADPAAAGYVRSVTGGDETVPLVVIDGTPHVNPRPGLVRDALAGPGRSRSGA